MYIFYGEFLHYKNSLVQFVHEYDNMFGNKEQKDLEDDDADSKKVIPCTFNSTIVRQFQQEYTYSMFRKVQQKFRKKGDCLIRGVTREGDLFRVNVDDQYLLYGEYRYCTYGVHFDPSSYKVRCNCNMFE